MRYDHRTIQLPIHPGDLVYVIDSGKGWTVREETVKMVVITTDEYLIATSMEPFEIKELYDEYFLTEDIAWEEADKQRPKPPYPFGYDEKMWMDAKIWRPWMSQKVYVRVKGASGKEYVMQAYYREPNRSGYSGPERLQGYYENNGENAQMINNVVAWMDAVYDINYVLNAKEYEE